MLVLGLVSFPTGVGRWFRGAPSGAAAAAVLAFALANAFFSGLTLFVTTRLDQWPSLPAGTSRPPVRGGVEVALSDVWFLLVAASVVISPLWILRQRGRGRADDLPPRRSERAQALDGVDVGFRHSVARARG